MPSKTASVPLEDIRDHIRLAQSFVKGLSLGRFRSDLRTVYAVTRCLEIISEASRRLPAGLKSRHPNISWKDIAGAGKVYRHDYEEVSTAVIWNTVKALGELLAVVETELLQPKPRRSRRTARKRPATS
jgi:uncharacterized protein with HEPN domain